MTAEEIIKKWNENHSHSQVSVNENSLECSKESEDTGKIVIVRKDGDNEMAINGTNGEVADSTDQAELILQLQEKIRILESRNKILESDINQLSDGGRVHRRDYFGQYIARECKSEEEKIALKEDVNSFWNRLTGYQTEENGHRTYGLAVGKVQSGKTRNYIGLMFKAIDAGYNSVIILTSKNRRLACQTHKRVFDWLNGENGLGISNYHGLTRALEGMQGVEWIGGAFDSNRIHVGVIIKNELGHLKQVREWLAKIGDSVRNMRMLFIDDEADSATPNTNNVGEPYINCVEDIDEYINQIRDSNIITLLGLNNWSEKKSLAVINWMESIKELTVADGMSGRVKNVIERQTTKDGLFRVIRTDGDLRSVLLLNADVDVGNGQKSYLYEVVLSCFGKDARRRYKKTFNWRVLVDLLYFVFSIQQERSRINRSICELVGSSDEYKARVGYQKLVYVAYTATPYANMYNEGSTNPLYPDCIIPLKTSSKYFGLQRIFGGAEENCNMDIVRYIGEEEREGWIVPIQSGEFNGDYSDDLVREPNFEDEDERGDVRCVEWGSLKTAIQWAFCTAAARRIKRIELGKSDLDSDTKYRWTTMLFNLSHLSSQEFGAHHQQQSIVQQYIAYVTKKENRDKFVQSCRDLWISESKNFSREVFYNACEGYGEIDGYPSVEKVVGTIRDWFLNRADKVQVIQMNSQSGDLDQSDYYNSNVTDGDVLWVVCGGNAIARGLTLDGLTVSYYDRIKRTTAIDTITQMGRWFGYRPGYELLPRIWMTAETVVEMKRICRVEESLHTELMDIYFDEENTTSFRCGRDISSVLYFGRRLSTRDANGHVDLGLTAKGTFEHVKKTHDGGLRATEEFLCELGEVYPIQEGMSKVLHKKHSLYWRNVPAEKVSEYISRLKDSYFSGVSVYDAAGLLREIQNSLQHWNVVVGNPDSTVTMVNGNMFSGYGVREGNDTRIFSTNEIKLGKRQVTSNAYLARIPDCMIAGLDERNVDVVYQSVSNKIADRSELLNPTLLIDFVHVNDGCSYPYVQVSFYWYGHSTESYFRAIENPDKPTFLHNVIDIVNEYHYLSRTALRRILKERFNYEDYKKSFDIDFENWCKVEEAPFGVVPQDVADRLVLSNEVVYSKSWLEGQLKELCCRDPFMIIGIDLYRRIKNNNWFYNENECQVNWESLVNNNADKILWQRNYFGLIDRRDQEFLTTYKALNEKLEWVGWLVRNGVDKDQHYKEGIERLSEIRMQHETLQSDGLDELIRLNELKKEAWNSFDESVRRYSNPLSIYQLWSLYPENDERKGSLFEKAKFYLKDVLAMCGSEQSSEFLSKVKDCIGLMENVKANSEL